MKSGILIGHIGNPRNESALIRTAESFGLNQIHIVEGSESHIVSEVSLGGEKHMSVHHYDSYEDFVHKIKSLNQSIVCVEYSEDSISIHNDDLEYPTNPVFVSGNENMGAPKTVIDNADRTVHIPMSGYTRCLNTTVAGSIVLNDWFGRDQDREQNEFDRF